MRFTKRCWTWDFSKKALPLATSCATGGGEGAGEVQVTERVDGTRAFTAYCPKCGLLHIEPDEMPQWFPCYESVAKWLGTQMECRGSLETVLPQKLWNVWRTAIAGQSRPIWVARALDDDIKQLLPVGKQPIFFVIFPQCDRSTVDALDRTFSISELTSIESGQLRFDAEVVRKPPTRFRTLSQGQDSPIELRVPNLA